MRDNGAMSYERNDEGPRAFRICFVCTGNICRSPMAEAVFRSLVRDAGFEDRIAVDSAATGDWHVGERADHRTVDALDRRGYDGSAHRARQFDADWFDDLDLVIAFDHGHERALRAAAPDDEQASKVRLLLSFDPQHSVGLDVPDPYYSDAALFDTVLATVERACRALLSQITPALGGNPASRGDA